MDESTKEVKNLDMPSKSVNIQDKSEFETVIWSMMQGVDCWLCDDSLPHRHATGEEMRLNRNVSSLTCQQNILISGGRIVCDNPLPCSDHSEY